MNKTEFRTGTIKPVECVREGWELIKNDYWILFAIGLVGGLIGGFTMYILFGAMICGIFYSYLQAIDGKPVSFDSLWKGFEFFVPGLIVTLFIVVPMIIVYILIYLPFIIAAVMGPKLSPDELTGLVVGALAVDFFVVIIMVCLHTLLMFSFPLIVDRGLGAVDAMKTSARAVWKNMGGVIGLIFVNIGLMLVGYLALCIGVYFVIPIMIAANVVAFRQVFPAQESANFHPPPPNAYRGI